MSKHSGPTDRTNRIVITPMIARAYWSKAKCWQHEKVSLVVETRHVPDDTPVKFQIWESDEGEGTPDDFIAELADGHKVKGNRCIVEHEITWDPDTLGKEIELEGDTMEFYFLVDIEAFALTRRSNLLYVDLHDYRISG